MKMQIRNLSPSAAFREALLRAIPFGVVAAFSGGVVWRFSPWYVGEVAGTVAIAAGGGGFLAALTFLVGYYRRSVFTGTMGAILASTLPLLGVFGFLSVVRIPLQSAPFWAFVPAGLIGEVVFVLAKKWSTVRM
jgi:hypothetical protein